MGTGKGTLLICCGAIANEVVSMITHNGWDSLHVQCLPAHLHNTPQLIPEAIRAKIRTFRGQFDDMVVLYSDCGTGGQLDAVLREEGVDRIGGAHCYDILAGQDEFAKMMEDEPGSFFVTGFLARNFERLVLKGLGLDRYPQMIGRFFENYTRLVYLAHTNDKKTRLQAEEAAKILGLRFEMRLVGSGEYQKFVASRCNLMPRP
ncbi:MAG: DUF1638 domain-containing protein [Hyphomicrobiales bacterium]|nr:DUF1638 domain-containing protein [Hyphomicrobiales bacterium]MCP5074220.1 DUF1638 domain-containing protein [Paracoccaceae bacterium]